MRKIEHIFKYHRCIINGGRRPLKTRQKKVTKITSFIFYDDKKILGKVGFQQQKCISFVALEFGCIYVHNWTKRFLKSHFTFYSELFCCDRYKKDCNTIKPSSYKYPYSPYISVDGSILLWMRSKLLDE